MVITQEPTQPLAALYGAPGVHVPIPREQQNIALALVIALSMVVIDIFIEGPSQRTLAKEDHLGQALILHRPDPALRISIHVRAARRQHERLDLTLSGNRPEGLSVLGIAIVAQTTTGCEETRSRQGE